MVLEYCSLSWWQSAVLIDCGASCIPLPFCYLYQRPKCKYSILSCELTLNTHAFFCSHNYDSLIVAKVPHITDSLLGWQARANHASTNLKKFLSWKLDKFTLFTHSLVSWNLENLYKHAMSVCFRLSWHFKREKSVFWKAYFLAKQELIMWARLHVPDFATGKNFSFNQSGNKEFRIFSWESEFIKALENFVPVFA